MRKSCGVKTSLVSAFTNPQQNMFKIAYTTRNNTNLKSEVRSYLKFLSCLITLENKLDEANYDFNNYYENLNKMINGLLETVFDYKFNFTLESPNLKNKPYFSGMGTNKIAKNIKKYIDQYKIKNDKNLNKDILHEFIMLKTLLKNIDYQGYTIAFGGSTKIYKNNEINQYGEFDGLIIFPNKKDENFLNIIEAKNKNKGANEAKNQLEDSLSSSLPNKLTFKIKKIHDRASIAKIYTK